MLVCKLSAINYQLSVCMQAPRVRRRKTSATSVSLFVRWYNPSGKTKVSHLALKPIETVDALQVTCICSLIDSFSAYRL